MAVKGVMMISPESTPESGMGGVGSRLRPIKNIGMLGRNDKQDSNRQGCGGGGIRPTKGYRTRLDSFSHSAIFLSMPNN